MRYSPAALALSLLLAVSASVGHTAEPPLDPRAAAFVEQARSVLAAGDAQAGVDLLETALVLDPGHSAILVELAGAAHEQDLQGKAIRYYREALKRNPHSVAALAGEGTVLAERGALDQAREKLARLETLCGISCEETRQLAAAIEAGPRARLVAAETVTPETVVTQN